MADDSARELPVKLSSLTIHEEEDEDLDEEVDKSPYRSGSLEPSHTTSTATPHDSPAAVKSKLGIASPKKHSLVNPMLHTQGSMIEMMNRSHVPDAETISVINDGIAKKDTSADPTSPSEDKGSIGNPAFKTKKRAGSVGTMKLFSLIKDKNNLAYVSTYVIDPEGLFATVWNFFTMLGRMYQCFVIPYRMAFGYANSSFGLTDITILLFDLIFIVDIFLKFRWGYMELGNKVMSTSLIKEHQLRQKTFITNVIASVPVNWVPLIMGRSRNELFMVNRLLRFFDISKEIRNLEKSYVVNPVAVRLAKLFFHACFIVHVAGCGIQLLSREEASSEWGITAAVKGDSTITQYVFSIQLALGMMSGTMDGQIGVTTLERMYTLSLFMLGTFLFAFVTSEFSVLVDSAAEDQLKTIATLSRVTTFFKKHSIGDDVSKKIMNYYTYLAKYGRYDSILSNGSLLEELPDGLRLDITMYLVEETVMKVPFLNQVNEPRFTHSIVKSLKHRTVSPEDIIISKNDVGTDVYFILDGKLGVYPGKIPDDATKIGELTSGQFFGEAALFGAKRTSTVKSLTFSNLYVLDVETFEEILLYFPGVKARVEEIAQKNAAENEEKSKKAAMENLMKLRENVGKAAADAGKAQLLRRDLDMPSMRKLTRSKMNPAKVVYHSMEPMSKSRQRWTLLMIMAVAYLYVSIPFRYVFLGNTFHIVTPWSVSWIVVDVLIDVMMFTHMFISFRQRYMKKGGVMEVDQKLIALHYLKGLFLFDFLGSLPIDYIVLMATGRVSLLYRFNRLLWCRHIVRFLALLKMKSDRSGLFSIISLGIWFFGSIHLFSCIYWSFTSFEGFGMVDDQGNLPWTPTANLQTVGATTTAAELVTQYLRANYFAVSVLVGLGASIPPTTNHEAIFMLVAIAYGMVTVAYVISTIGNLMTSVDQNESLFRSKRQRMERFIQGRRIPTKFALRVNRFYDLAWKMQKGDNFNGVLDLLPSNMRAAVKRELFDSSVVEKLIMGSTNTTVKKVPESLLNAIISNLKLELYPQGEFVVEEGETGNKMFFITAGECEIMRLRDDGKEQMILKVIGKGEFFGEGALFIGRRKASIRARTACELLSLLKSHFENCLRPYPDLEKGFKEIARERYIGMEKQAQLESSKRKPVEASKNVLKKLVRKVSVFGNLGGAKKESKLSGSGGSAESLGVRTESSGFLYDNALLSAEGGSKSRSPSAIRRPSRRPSERDSIERRHDIEGDMGEVLERQSRKKLKAMMHDAQEILSKFRSLTVKDRSRSIDLDSLQQAISALQRSVSKMGTLRLERSPVANSSAGDDGGSPSSRKGSYDYSSSPSRKGSSAVGSGTIDPFLVGEVSSSKSSGLAGIVDLAVSASRV